MQQDRANSRTNSQTNKSVAANNNNTAGVSMPAVSPLIALSPQKEVAQLVKITSKTLNQTIETTTETDVELLLKFQALRWKNPQHAEAIDKRLNQLSLRSKTLNKTIYPSIETDVGLLLQFRERFNNNKQALAKIDARLQELNPLLGFEQAIPMQTPPPGRKKKNSTQRLLGRHEKVLVDTGTDSEKRGQEFKKQALPNKFTPMTNPDGERSKVPRIKVEKLTTWAGQPLRLQWFPDIRGGKKVSVPYILCVYTLEWIKAEEADMDHVIPTASLKKHLLAIAGKMTGDTGYTEGVKFWLKQKGLNFNHWFIQGTPGIWSPTEWAMLELHNNPNNLVFSSKLYNQIGKNAKDPLKLIEENPWYGDDFFKQVQFAPSINIGISTTTGKGIAPEMESFLFGTHSETIEDLGEEKEQERIMAQDIKLRGMGKLLGKSRKGLKRKQLLKKELVFRKNDDVSSGSESESDDTALRKGMSGLIESTGLQDEFIPKEKVEEGYLPWETVNEDYISREKVERKFLPTKKVNEDYVPRETFTRSEKRKDTYKRRSLKFKEERDEHKGARDSLQLELARLREELAKRDKELKQKDVELKEKDVELSRKRRRSDEQPKKVKKPRPLNVKLTEHYRNLDDQLEESYDTNRQRISPMRKDYNSAQAFIDAFEGKLRAQYTPDGWRKWKFEHPDSWSEIRDTLQAIFDQRR